MNNLESLKAEIKRLKEKHKRIIIRINKLTKEYNSHSRLEHCNGDDCSCPSLVPNDSDF
jgi:hypothetical protein